MPPRVRRQRMLRGILCRCRRSRSSRRASRSLAETGETVLAAALRAGLNLPHSCKGGHCASCRARILDGTIGYVGDTPPGITADEVREGYALLCQALALTDLRVEVREVRPAPDVEVKSLPCRIDRMQLVAADVMAVFLRLPAVEELHYRPGQYLDVMLSEGRRRSFSIASAPADGPTARAARASRIDHRLHGAAVREHARGRAAAHRGSAGAVLVQDRISAPAIMVGGGTGYAPLRAMIRQLLATGDRRPITLYWGARDIDGLYEHDWLEELARTRPGFVYRPVLSDRRGVRRRDSAWPRARSGAGRPPGPLGTATSTRAGRRR